MLTISSKTNTAHIYAASIDVAADGFLRALCASPAAENSRIRVMPDVHGGKGSVVGLTMTITDRIIPGIVGVDISCGLLAVHFATKRIDFQRLDKLIHERIPSGREIRTSPHRFADRIDLDRFQCARHIQAEKAALGIGTLGGGNHFIEIDRAPDGSYWLLIHSGSRHLGVEVATHYQNLAHKACPGESYEMSWLAGELMQAYLHDMVLAQEYAEQNRQAMADEIIRGMKWNALEQISTVHNYVDMDAMILRKGAVSAKVGERLVIPMNMRDGCLLCVGKGNAEWNESAPHGAGRLMSRTEAKQSFTLSQYKKAMAGVYSSSVSRETLDESPMAYKPMEAIVDAIGETAEVVDRWESVYNFKAEESE